jgi:hypothetical protein
VRLGATGRTLCFIFDFQLKNGSGGKKCGKLQLAALSAQFLLFNSKQKRWKKVPKRWKKVRQVATCRTFCFIFDFQFQTEAVEKSAALASIRFISIQFSPFEEVRLARMNHIDFEKNLCPIIGCLRIFNRLLMFPTILIQIIVHRCLTFEDNFFAIRACQRPFSRLSAIHQSQIPFH